MSFLDDIKKHLDGAWQTVDRNVVQPAETAFGGTSTTAAPLPAPAAAVKPAALPQPGGGLPTPQHASLLHDLTHNDVTDFLGSAVKPIVRTGIAVNQGVANAERAVAGEPSENAQQFTKQSYGGIPGFNNAIGYTGTKRQILGDIAQTGLTALTPGLSKAAEDIVAQSLPSLPKLIVKPFVGAATGAPVGAAYNTAALVSSGAPLTAHNLWQATKQGAEFGAGFGAGGELAGIAAPKVIKALHALPDQLRANTLKTASTHVPVVSLPTSSLYGTDLTGFGDLDPKQVGYYKQQLQQGKPIEPLLVMKGQDGHLHVEDGKHRLAASRALGIQNVPAKVVTPADIKKIAQGGYVKLPGASDAADALPEQNESTYTPTANDAASVESPVESPNRQANPSVNDTPLPPPKPADDGVVRIQLDPSQPPIEVHQSDIDAIQRQLDAETPKPKSKAPAMSPEELASLDSHAPAPQPQTAPLDLQEPGMTPIGDIMPTTMDRIIANSTDQAPEDVATERIRKSLFQKRQKLAEAAALDHLRIQKDPQSETAAAGAQTIYKHLMERKNGGDAEAARVVKRLQGNVQERAINPIKIDLPKVAEGDYTRARTVPQTVNSLVQNRLAQVLPALNRLSARDKATFWHTVEDPELIKDATSPASMQVAVQRWRDLADTVHATSRALGGGTKYIANYARHNWDLTNPEDIAKMQQLINERGGASVDPYNFGGVNRMPRVFNSIKEGEAADFRLKNPENPAADVLDYANGVSSALERQALSKAFTEADAGEELKNRSFDLRQGFTLPLSEKGLKEIQSYNPVGDANRVAKWYRTANRAAKQTLLSLSLFHPININMLQAFPTLLVEGHPEEAMAGAGRSWAALFSPKFAETMHQNFLKDGTTEWAAKMGTPLRYGSDFSSTGKFIVGKNNAFDRAIFDRSIAAMQGTMVQAARKDLEAHGFTADSPEALKLGLQINKIMGFVNKEVENRMRHGNTLSSDLLLAPQFTRAKWSVLKDAFTKGGLHGSYARAAVAGKYAIEATIALAAAYLTEQKSDDIRDILLRTLVHPSIPTPFKDSKGNNIELGLPQNYASEALNLVTDLGRNKKGRLNVGIHPSEIAGNLENYARERLGVLPAAAFKAVTNTNFAGNPLRDTNAPDTTQAVQAFTNLTNDVLPIGLQGVVQTNAVRRHLPQDVQSALKVSTSGGNPLVKSVASSFGVTPRTDQTTGKGLQTAQYYNDLAAATRHLNPNDKAAWNVVHPTTKDPVTGKYITQPTVFDTPAKAATYLAHPNVLVADTRLNKQIAATGQKVDPFFTKLTPAQQKAYLEYQTMPPDGTDQKDWRTKNAWYSSFEDARNAFFNSLPPGDPNKPSLSLKYPDASKQVSAEMDTYSKLTDSTAKVDFLDAHPEVQQQFGKIDTYYNQLRQARGYAAFKGYPSAPPQLQDFLNQYMAASTGARKSLKSDSPDLYNQMNDYFDKVDLYTIGNQGAISQLQGEPDTTNQELKDIYNLGQYSIFKDPTTGTFSLNPQAAESAGSSSYSSHKSLKSGSASLGALRKLLVGTTKTSSNPYKIKTPKVVTTPKLAALKPKAGGYAQDSTVAALKKMLHAS